MEGHGRSCKIIETGRMFGLCDHLSSCMTLVVSKLLGFSPLDLYELNLSCK